MKVYLGKDYISETTFGLEPKGFIIGEAIDISETGLEVEEIPPQISISGSVYVGEPKINGGCLANSVSSVVQDCAGNIIDLSPDEIESAYIHSTSELWK
jgi:hypothetical protein